MTRKGHFTVEVYDCTVHIIVTTHIRASINYYLRKNNEEIINDSPSGFMYSLAPDFVGNYYVFFDVEDLSVDVVNHEKCHLVEAILEDRDITAKDEVRAYLDGYVSKKFNEFFKKRKMKLKNSR